MALDMRALGKIASGWSDSDRLLEELSRLAKIETLETLEALARARLAAEVLGEFPALIGEAEARVADTHVAYNAAVAGLEAVSEGLLEAESELSAKMSSVKHSRQAIRQALGDGRREELMPLEAAVARAKETHRAALAHLSNLRRCAAALEGVGRPDGTLLSAVLSELV